MRLKIGDLAFSRCEIYVNGQKIRNEICVYADEEAGEVACYYTRVNKEKNWEEIAYFPEDDVPLPVYIIHGKVELKRR